jgi:5,10-methylenetetrahydrofolate reductase
LPAAFDNLFRRAPVLWLEVAPPRGVNPELLLKRLVPLAGHVDAINLTDNALGRVKMSGLVFGSLIKARLGIPVVLNLSCRDRNRFALKSDLLGAGALRFDGVIAVPGDRIPPDDTSGVRSVHDLDTTGLLNMIAALNRGDTGEGRALLKTLPDLAAGSVGNPYRQNLEREFELLARRAEAGARFLITQPIFDADTARRFLAGTDRLKLRTVFGILPLKREAMAEYMKKRVKDLAAAHHHLDRYRGMSESQVRSASLADNLALMKSLAGEAAGFNIMSGGGPSLAIELALEFSKWRQHRSM